MVDAPLHLGIRVMPIKRWRGEESLLEAIVVGIDCDPTPFTAEGLTEAMRVESEGGINFPNPPLYRVSRNLWMLVHTGALIAEKRDDGKTWFKPGPGWEQTVKQFD